MIIEVSWLLKNDYLNEYAHIMVQVQMSIKTEDYVWPSDLRVKKFWERYNEFANDIISTPEDDQKISHLDALADEINPLLNVEPRAIPRLVKANIAACRICGVDLYVKQWEQFLYSEITSENQ